MNRLLFLAALALLAACNRNGEAESSAAVQQGADRTVADVRAAQAAAAGTEVESRSAGASAQAARSRADRMQESARAKAARQVGTGDEQVVDTDDG